MPRPTVAVIDIARIRHNIRQVQSHVGPMCRLCVAVKADGYGHGAVPVARAALREDAAMLGVADTEEGVELRDAGITHPVLILGHVLPEDADDVVAYGLTAALANRELADAISAAAERTGRAADVFVNVDTGMGRVGVCPVATAPDLIMDIAALPGLNVSGVLSHFPSSDEPDKAFSHQQIRQFERLVDELRSRGLRVQTCSLANTAATIDLPTSHFDMVRPGLMVYGFTPSPHVSRALDLQPALSLKSAITFLKRVPRGTTLGYGRTYTVPVDDSVIATVPIGYADGYSRSLSNRAPVLVGGRRFAVAGRVSMDQITVDLGPDAAARIGDEVVLIGEQGGARISAQEIAELMGTIVYEVTCGISKRVPRRWANEGS